MTHTDEEYDFVNLRMKDLEILLDCREARIAALEKDINSYKRGQADLALEVLRLEKVYSELRNEHALTIAENLSVRKECDEKDVRIKELEERNLLLVREIDLLNRRDVRKEARKWPNLYE
jgi:uncharacterized protein YhaN